MQSLCPEPPIVFSPAETVVDNDDLLRHILLRVPAKPLVRFKCVSRHWLSLIDDPKFRHCHTLQNPKSKVSGFFLRSSITLNPQLEFIPICNENNSPVPASNPLSFLADIWCMKILQSCNGLLLCWSTVIKTYFVVNPTTSQFVPLHPTYAGFQSVFHFMGVSLAFDPSKSPYYKIVCVVDQLTHRQIVIYSSQTQSWSLQECTFYQDICYNQGVYCNGAIHWISNITDQVSRYDIDEGRNELVQSPSGQNRLPRHRLFRYFGESCGHLHLIDIYSSCVTQFDVMEMAMDYSGWFVKYNVDLNRISTMFPEMIRDHLHFGFNDCYTFCVLFVGREEDEENASLVLHIPDKVISYNFKDKTAKKVGDLTPKGSGAFGSLQLAWGDAYYHMATFAHV